MRSFIAYVERRFVERHWRIEVVKALRQRLRAPAHLPYGEQSAKHHHQTEPLFVRDPWSLRQGAYQLHLVPSTSTAALPHGISLLLSKAPFYSTLCILCDNGVPKWEFWRCGGVYK
ncbi:hypothetical protein H0G86_010578 [Trichoderma simmonsii]|uniref:Uncharacterized protein n=1 Tax=Trichoderma simmonsii TaxID=1491479 RepID=A0A8G0LKD1_9HYPO|nr:hypothetical protein H0G86_010578 [Trichoderma simmonsii]